MFKYLIRTDLKAIALGILLVTIYEFVPSHIVMCNQEIAPRKNELNLPLNHITNKGLLYISSYRVLFKNFSIHPGKITKAEIFPESVGAGNFNAKILYFDHRVIQPFASDTIAVYVYMQADLHHYMDSRNTFSIKFIDDEGKYIKTENSNQEGSYYLRIGAENVKK